MTREKKIELMTTHCSNRLLAHLSNELYHDYDEMKDDFKEYQLAINEAISKANKDFIKNSNRANENKKIENIHQTLTKWREERHLEYWTQKQNLLGNIMEELTEFCRAKDNKNEMIDALCDICVFTFNSTINSFEDIPKNYLVLALDYNTEKVIFAKQILDYVANDEFEYIVGLCFSVMKQMKYDPFKCMEETIKEISSRTGHYDSKLGKFVKDTGIYNDAKSKKKFEDEMKEFYLTAMRFNYYDDYVDVIDDTNQEVLVTYRLWYQADYSKCKIKK